MRSTPSGCCWRCTRRRTSFLCLEKAFNRVPRDLIWRSHGAPKSPYGGTSSSTPTPSASSDAQLACLNGSRSPSVCTRDPPSPCSCSSFVWTRPWQTSRCLSPGHIYSPTLFFKLTNPIVGLNIKCKFGASGWTCTDCTSTSRRLSTWSAGPRPTGQSA